MNLIESLCKVSAVAALALLSSAGNAVVLQIGDPYYIGSIDDPTPASPAADRERVTNIIGLDPGDSVFITGVIADDAIYDRSNNIFILPDVGSDCGQGGNGNTKKALGCHYFIQKFGGDDGFAYVWDISNITDDVQTVDRDGFDNQSNQWQAFNGVFTPPGPNSVPAPATLALLSIGLLGIGAARKLKKH